MNLCGKWHCQQCQIPLTCQQCTDANEAVWHPVWVLFAGGGEDHKGVNRVWLVTHSFQSFTTVCISVRQMTACMDAWVCDVWHKLSWNPSFACGMCVFVRRWFTVSKSVKDGFHCASKNVYSVTDFLLGNSFCCVCVSDLTASVRPNHTKTDVAQLLWHHSCVIFPAMLEMLESRAHEPMARARWGSFHDCIWLADKFSLTFLHMVSNESFRVVGGACRW